MTRSKLCLVGGGARSGKSAFALRLGLKRGIRRAYVATAEAHDAEMRARIHRHREERAGQFETFEVPRGLAGRLRELHDFDCVVLDCLTLYTSNLLLGHHQERLDALDEPRSHGPSSSVRPAAGDGSSGREAGHESEVPLSSASALAQAAHLAENELEDLAVAAAEFPGQLIVVTNEVGCGIVPDNALARAFRDVAGRANQMMATRADEVYLAMFGQLLRIKPAPVMCLHPESEKDNP